MGEKRQLHFGAFMRPITIHTGAWRYPGAYADANFNFEHLKRFAQKLEVGKFDAFFMASVNARFSFVFIKTDDDWKILSHHSSVLPESH